MWEATIKQKEFSEGKIIVTVEYSNGDPKKTFTDRLTIYGTTIPVDEYLSKETTERLKSLNALEEQEKKLEVGSKIPEYVESEAEEEESE